MRIEDAILETIKFLVTVYYSACVQGLVISSMSRREARTLNYVSTCQVSKVEGRHTLVLKEVMSVLLAKLAGLQLMEVQVCV